MGDERVSALRLASAGIAVVGVCFGMARYGYGLLLPDVRRDYALGPDVLGLIGTGSYAAYLLATVLTGSLASRVGPRATTVTAALLASAGMVVVGLSRSPAVFAAGIVLAGTGAALSFAPIADAARVLAPVARGRVLAAVNCGTGYGVALAAPIAIIAGMAWHGMAWRGAARGSRSRSSACLPRCGRRACCPAAAWGRCRRMAGAASSAGAPRRC